MSTLKATLESLPDHRSRHGQEYRLSSLLLLVLAGFLCGCNSLLAVWRFSQRLTREQREALGFHWFKVPSHPTLCVALHGIDVDALEAALSQAALLGQGNEPLHFAIDGKTLRGSGGVHLLSCFSDSLKATVGQRKAGRGYDEVTAAIELLKALPLNRNHWGIENRLHRNKDVLLREDASSVRTGAAPQALAALRNLTLRLLAAFDPSPTIAREIAQHDRNKIIQLLA